MPTFKLIVNLRGNKPLLLDKVIYTEHPLSKILIDSFISDYKPNMTKNHPDKIKIKEKKKEQQQSDHKEKLSWDTF